jgi:hypothetical protein
MKKKINLLIIALLMFVVGINNVNALQIMKGDESSKSGNTVRRGLQIKFESGDEAHSMEFECYTDNDDVSCTVEAGSKYQSYIFVSGNTVSTSSDTFPIGDPQTDILVLVLKNNSSTKQTVKVSVKATINGTTYTTINGNDYYSVEVDPATTTKAASSDAKASSIKFSQGTMVPAFSSTTTDYTVYNIADTINSVTASYTCDNCTAGNWTGASSVNGNKITLNMGENKVSITLQSEDGKNEQTYNFTIIRGATTFNSSKLSSITVGDYKVSPEFDKNTLEYTVTVPNTVTTLANILKFTSEDTNANISTDPYDNLSVGENIINITVDNVNADETTTYKLTVTRMDDGDIQVTNYINSTITFIDSEGTKSTLSESEFKVQYPEEYEKITNGTYKFDDEGNIITETETEEEEKTTSKKSNKRWIIILLIVIGLIIIVVSGIFIFKKPNDKNNKKGGKPEESDNSSIETKTEDDAEINEEGIEEAAVKWEHSHNSDDTMDIDEALSDLMSTKQYNLEDLGIKKED